MPKPPAPSPNPDIDKAIASLMKRVHAKGDESIPPDTAVKIINSAVAWEKVKRHISDQDSGFDPDLL